MGTGLSSCVLDGMQEVLCESWGKKELYAEGAEIAEGAEKIEMRFSGQWS